MKGKGIVASTAAVLIMCYVAQVIAGIRKHAISAIHRIHWKE